MRIAIIGAGHVGQALAPAWLKRGHELRFGVPNPSDAKYRGLAAPAARPPEAAREAEVIVLATPWHATEAAIRSLGDVSGRIVIG